MLVIEFTIDIRAFLAHGLPPFWQLVVVCRQGEWHRGHLGWRVQASIPRGVMDGQANLSHCDHRRCATLNHLAGGSAPAARPRRR